jgi:hypothetical protein
MRINVSISMSGISLNFPSITCLMTSEIPEIVIMNLLPTIEKMSENHSTESMIISILKSFCRFDGVQSVDETVSVRWSRKEDCSICCSAEKHLRAPMRPSSSQLETC